MSTVPAVVSALVTLAEATFSTDEWQITDGPPDVETQRTPRILAIGDEEFSVTTQPDSLGNSMAERYTVPVTVSVMLPSADLTPARTAAFDAWADFRSAVLGAVGRNLGLGGQFVIDAVPADDLRVQFFPRPEGRSVAIHGGVNIYAQLT